MSDELKIVISFKENAASIGLQKPDCDPIFSKIEGSVPVVLKAIPKLVADAQASWEANPKYKKCETDLKPPTPPAPAARPAARVSSGTTRSKKTDQKPLL